jgi:hypothetical protein
VLPTSPSTRLISANLLQSRLLEVMIIINDILYWRWYSILSLLFALVLSGPIWDAASSLSEGSIFKLGLVHCGEAEESI